MANILAKTMPKQSLREHTDELLRCWEELCAYAPSFLSERERELLRLAAEYHDVGKVQPAMQRRMRGGGWKRDSSGEGLHGFVSLLFLPELLLTETERKILMQAIAYHHERNVVFFEEIRAVERFEKERENCIPLLQEEGFLVGEGYGASDVQTYIERRFGSTDPAWMLYVKIKGMLHRLDHAASAGVPLEMHQNVSVGDAVHAYVSRWGMRDIQRFAEAHRGENALVVGQTGIGKMEAGLLWAGDDKTFLTLPYRVSLNAQYQRAVEQLGLIDENGPIPGLLHSGSLPVLERHYEEDVTSLEEANRQTALLSRKLTFCTVDQVLKFPLLFRGFEKWWATFGYSKLIVDEIQAYEPKVMAIVVTALKMIHEMGGTFFLMTATLPEIVKDKLEEWGVPFQYRVYVDDSWERHRLSLERTTMIEGAASMLETGKEKRVLVICNTVKQVLRLQEKLQALGASPNMLHAYFTQRDRREKETALLAFAPNNREREKEAGIWITTQVVEASVDADFDVLYTEAATLDSLFQRFGRVYRNRQYVGKDPNVWVFTEKPSGVSNRKQVVYEGKLVKETLSLLENWHGKILKETEKTKMVSELYNASFLKRKGTRYWREWKNALETLENLSPYSMSAKEAQEMLRDLGTVLVVPRCFQKDEGLVMAIATYKSKQEELEVLKIQGEREKILRVCAEIRRIVRIIEGYSVSVPVYKIKENDVLWNIKGLEHLRWSERAYSFEKGLE